LAKKPHERPTSREALILIPSFVKKAYQDSRNEKKNLKAIASSVNMNEASIDETPK
jgi:hypothetical protein